MWWKTKDAALVSYTDENGTTYYSFDDGETWTAMTDEEFAAAYPEPEVEWWTAAEYAAWLENEKKNLQDMIGSKRLDTKHRLVHLDPGGGGRDDS